MFSNQFSSPFSTHTNSSLISTYPGSRLDVSKPFGVCWSLESILIISMVMMMMTKMTVSADGGA